MNYIGRFGLEFNPFLKTARHETVIETTEYKEVNYRLDLLLKAGIPDIEHILRRILAAGQQNEIRCPERLGILNIIE